MSIVGTIVKFAVGLLALEATQVWKRWRSAPMRVPQAEPLTRQPLKVVQGGRR